MTATKVILDGVAGLPLSDQIQSLQVLSTGLEVLLLQEREAYRKLQRENERLNQLIEKHSL